MDRTEVEINYMGIKYIYVVTKDGDCISKHNRKWLFNLRLKHHINKVTPEVREILVYAYKNLNKVK